MNSVTETDLVRLLGLADSSMPAHADEEFPGSVLAGLREIIPCTDITFQLTDGRQNAARGCHADDSGTHDLGEDGCDDDAELSALLWSSFWTDGGCSYPQDSGDCTTVFRQSDLMSDLAYAKTGVGACMQRWGVRHEVLVPLLPQGITDRRLLLFRSDGPDFSERDLLLLRMFRPHLNEIHLRQQRLSREQPELTPRQWQILRLVAAGAANADVARVLFVSAGTVRKHLENIFQRLDVHTRTQAVVRVASYLDVA